MLRWESLLRGPFHFDDFTWNCIMLECDKIFPKKFYKQYFYWRVYSYLQLESHDVMNLCQEYVSSFNKWRLFHIWCYSMKCTIEKNELEAFSGLIYSPHLLIQPGFIVRQEISNAVSSVIFSNFHDIAFAQNWDWTSELSWVGLIL